MTWLTAIAGVLRAIPEISKTLSMLNDNIIRLGDARTEMKINNIKRDLDEITAKVKDTEDRKKLLDLAEQLNNARV